jgi:hypothetical protein
MKFITVGTSTIINSAADDKCSKITAAGPSTGAGLSPGSVLKIVSTAYASADGVSKLAEPVAKNTIRSDNICNPQDRSVILVQKKGEI